MKITDTRPSRRRFIALAGAAAAAAPFAALVPAHVAGAADLPKLALDDPTASALGYVHDSTTDGQQCKNCALWQGADNEWGPCPLFPGKAVSANGWCKSWVKKP